MKFSATALLLIIATSKINGVAGQALPPGWTDMGPGKCVDSSNNEFDYVFSYPKGNTCGALTQTKKGCVEFCECFMTFYNGFSAMMGVSWGTAASGLGWDCACYYDSSWDCANEITYPVQCYKGTGGTGSITGTGPMDPYYSSQDCLGFAASPTTVAPVTTAPTTSFSPTKKLNTSSPTKAPVSSSPSKAPISSSSPTKAPVSSSPTKATITSAPTKAPVSSSPTKATITSAPTKAPVSSSPTKATITSSPSGKPVATTSAPTGKPTAASKTSKTVKATKVPSAKSSKSAKLA